MHKPSTYLVVTYFPTYLPLYICDLFPNINSVEVHPQLSNNGHPVDGALVGAGSLWPNQTRYIFEMASIIQHFFQKQKCWGKA